MICYYKVRQFYHNVPAIGITKCNDYYKVRQNRATKVSPPGQGFYQSICPSRVGEVRLSIKTVHYCIVIEDLQNTKDK